MHTRKQIIDNQEKFKEEIFRFFIKETIQAKKELRGIDTKNEFIQKEKEKLLKKFKKVNTVKSIDKYFYFSKKRDSQFYVWWSEKEEEALILTYGKN